MSVLPRQPGAPILLADWQPEVTQLLDEHHLIAWSEFPQRRTQFAVSLGQFLGSLRDADVCVLYGKYITDLESFCYQLERAIPGPALMRRVHGPGGIVSLLRERATVRGRAAAKFRFYVWHDADVLLRSDHVLFGQIADALAGVAAEAEYVSDDLLLIHRTIFVGSSLLEVYAEDPAGQFQNWARDDHDEPFWQAVTGIAQPPFMRYPIDTVGPIMPVAQPREAGGKGP
ncbi:MAG TPA: hypothetical protein VD971_00555 [Phycisphaerales bacterium]|nr:hypothetical protein [Phycisphaerales bacterium]